MLSIVGGEDRFLKGVERMTGVVPDHEMVIIPGASHFSTLYSPVFEQSLLEFLDTHTGGKAPTAERR